MEGGIVQCWGTYDAGTTTWTLTGVSTVANPSTTGDITRAVESKVLVNTGGGGAGMWDWSSSNPSGCMAVWDNAIAHPLTRRSRSTAISVSTTTRTSRAIRST